MRLRIKHTFALLLTVAATSAAQAVAQTPIVKPERGSDYRAELAVGYSYLHSNAPPGGCGCFNMNGGNAQAAFRVYRGLSAVADINGETTPSVNNGAYGLSLVSFTAGPRFTYSFNGRLSLYGQSLFGAAHGFDSYFPVTSGSTSASNGFAWLAGGGMDIHIARRLSIRAVEVDYFPTYLPNGVNGVERNLRLSTGLVLRIR